MIVLVGIAQRRANARTGRPAKNGAFQSVAKNRAQDGPASTADSGAAERGRGRAF